MITKRMREEFETLACRMSPESLTCDGECSHAEVRRRYNQCVKEWRALEKQAGRTVTLDEIEQEMVPWYRCRSTRRR